MKFLILIMCAVVGAVIAALLSPFLASPPSQVLIGDRLEQPCGLFAFTIMAQWGMRGLLTGAGVGILINILRARNAATLN